MVVEAETHENYYSGIETDSEITDSEASDEDLPLNPEIEDSQRTSLEFTPSIFFVHEPKKTLNLTTDTLDCDNILVNQANDSVLKLSIHGHQKAKCPQKTWNHDNSMAYLATQINLKNCLLTKKHN